MKESAGWMIQLLQKKDMSGIPHKGDLEMALDKIEKSIERAKKITHQLLGFVRKGDSVLSEIDLRKLADEATDLVNLQASKRNIAIVKETDDTLKTIYSDPYRLRQVLVNLMNNAIHASEPGGTVTLIFSGTAEEVAVTVRDTGGGIPKENLDRIFEPFFTTKSAGEGTGLGLFVSRGIIEKLGGKIALESRVGQGTSFTVKLPRRYVPADGTLKEVEADSLDELAKKISQTPS